MKKLFCLAITALLAMSFTFTSCSKDDDEVATPDSLEGTIWMYSNGDRSLTLNFETFITVKMSIVNPTSGNTTSTGMYNYSKPDFTITFSDGEVSGTVNGNKMTLYLDNDITLTRK
jgi:hypothetical protein